MVPIKIFYIISGLEKGGAETQLFNLLKYSKHKKNICVVSLKNSGYYGEKINKLGIEVIELNINSLKSYIQSINILKRIILKKNPQLIHSWLPHANILTKLSLLRISKKYPLLISIRVKEIVFFFQNLFDRILDTVSQKVITNSDSIKNFLTSKLFYSDKKIEVIYNGVEKRELDKKLVNTIKKSYKKKIILTVANFRKQKDYETNVLTCKHLIKKRKDIIFLYIGEGDEINIIKNLVKKYSLQKYIKFLGRQDNVPEYINASEIFFLPSLYEGQSNVLIEAAFYGKRIVCSDIEENRETVYNASFGILKNPSSFSKLIMEELGKDPFIYSQEFISKFDLQKMVQKYQNIYNSILENKK
jgi:glycosyltransferase involved in cell wall biosynthesis